MSTESTTLAQPSLAFATPTLIGSLTALPNYPPPVGGGTNHNYCAYAPLIDAKQVNSTAILVRITLLVDSSVTNVSVPTTQPQNNPTVNPAGLQITIDYASAPDANPTGVINLWYLELEYNANVNTVAVFLQDTDPIGSRGTETTVQPG